MPVRIQRKRTKGWKMPPNTVYVGRGSRYGNPFLASRIGHEEAVHRYRQEVAPYLDVGPLRRANLACWCPLDQPCHADVLLELANAQRAVGPC